MAKVGRPKKIYQTLTGMHDILPEDWSYFQKVFRVVEEIANFYGFSRIETPIIENVEIFEKGTGLTTDIVEKQMYIFRTKGGDHVALRPEGTPCIARAYIQHGMQNLPQPVKLWHFGPFFRYETPQAGRYRQFWQFGFEVFGERNPIIDAQIIQIFYNILHELKFKNLIIEVNSIGCPSCRAYYKKILVNYFKGKEVGLCSECRRRLRENPLRILDCKEEKCQLIKAQAPQIIDHLCEECHNHFKEVLEFLDELELPYHLDPYLVRGLDYYTKTVFEIFLEGKKDYNPPTTLPNGTYNPSNTSTSSPASELKFALVGGGRYDNLVKLLGGKETPACGGAGGVERIIEMLKKEQIKIRNPILAPKIFLAQLGPLAKRKNLKLFEEFRKAGIPVAESFGRDSLKAQLRIADKLGVKYSLILGQKEALEDTIIIRDMVTGRQETVKLDKVVKDMKKKLKNN